MKLRRFLLTAITILLATNTFSQNDTIAFKPSGTVFGTAFMDYSTGLNSNSNTSGFDLTRALLGYNYQFLPTLQATISIDGAAGKSTNDKLEVHVRNAFATWSDHGFTVDLGLITLNQFLLQQNMWGHRYAFQTYQDLAGMGQAIDLGLQARYDFCSVFSADMGITNGEGYKKIRKDKSMRYSVGATLRPVEHFVFRAYADVYTIDKDRFNQDGVGVSSKNQFTYSVFAGYESRLTTTGIEFSKQINNCYIKGNHMQGMSIFSTVNLNSKWNVYARYDLYDSKESLDNQHGWYSDRQVIIAGIEYKPFSFLRFSPNFRNYNYAKSSSQQYIFVSGEFSF